MSKNKVPLEEYINEIEKINKEDVINIAKKVKINTIYFLRDKKINYCTGCGLCNDNGYTDCSQKDDAPEILEKMVQADVIVMATPVYFYTMNGQLKTLIDRCCSRYTSMIGKDFYFIATAADMREQALERTFDGLRGFTACLDGAQEKGLLYAAGVWQKDEVKRTRYMNEAHVMGKNV